MIGSSNPRALSAFYAKVFGRPADMSEEEGEGYSGWQFGDSFFTVGPHSEIKGKAKEPQRVILNFETAEVKEEFERIKSAGAEVIKEPYELEGAWIATFADPEGNYFQLMTPWENMP
jgi:predicted enzyme related to lactoylglutathione lyase